MDRKVILYIAVSLDGFIADKDGSVDWLSGEENDTTSDSSTVAQENNSYEELLKDIDTIIMGMTTYRQVVTELSPDVWPYQGIKSYILTSKPEQDKEDIIFVNTNVKNLIKQLKEQEGKDIWIVGGANVANQLIKDNMIDEYQITTMPIILGQGIRLFEQDNKTIYLQLDSVKQYDDMVLSIYSRKNK